jgi:hypothetical protein
MSKHVHGKVQTEVLDMIAMSTASKRNGKTIALRARMGARKKIVFAKLF